MKIWHFRAAFFVIFVGVVGFFSFPKELTHDQLHSLFQAYGTTLLLTFLGLLLGIFFGAMLSFAKTFGIQILNFVIDEYIDIIRGTPLLVQLLVFAFVIFAAFPDNFFACVIALGLNSSAYVAEIIRSGVNSVSTEQHEAARALGLGKFVTMIFVVYPQALKNILPALVNEFLMLFKETSIVSFIGVMDLTMAAKILQATTYSPLPLVFVGVIYYANVRIFSFLAQFLEKKLND